MILNGKNAIITGANRGIGKKIVEIFAQNGASIWTCRCSFIETKMFLACDLSNYMAGQVIRVDGGGSNG